MRGSINSVLDGPICRIIVGLVIGFAFLITGGFSVSKATQLRTNGVEVQGKVISIRVVVRKRGRSVYPMVEFVDADGIKHQKEMGGSTLNEGDTVTVLYIPDNPEIADIKSVTSTSPTFGYILMCLSLVGWMIAGYNGYTLMKPQKQIV